MLGDCRTARDVSYKRVCVGSPKRIAYLSECPAELRLCCSHYLIRFFFLFCLGKASFSCCKEFHFGKIQLSVLAWVQISCCLLDSLHQATRLCRPWPCRHFFSLLVWGCPVLTFDFISVLAANGFGFMLGRVAGFRLSLGHLKKIYRRLKVSQRIIYHMDLALCYVDCVSKWPSAGICTVMCAFCIAMLLFDCLRSVGCIVWKALHSWIACSFVGVFFAGVFPLSRSLTFIFMYSLQR